MAILKLISDERDKAAGLLTEEGAAALLYASLDTLPVEPPPPEEEIEQPEEPEPEGPPGFIPTFTAASGEKVATALELEIMGKLTEASGLDSSHFKVTEKSEGISVEALKFLSDRWNHANALLEGMGFDYVSGKDGTRFWVMQKPKPKTTIIKNGKVASPTVEGEVPSTPQPKITAEEIAKGAKKPAQQRIEKPKTIREAEALLIEKFGATVLKSVIVTEDARSIDVEPQANLPLKQQEAITNFLAKFGATKMDTGMPPGYVWVIKK